MFKKLLPIGIDEIIAVLLLGISTILSSLPVFHYLQQAAIVYIVICIIFRKYEAVQHKLRKAYK